MIWAFLNLFGFVWYVFIAVASMIIGIMIGIMMPIAWVKEWCQKLKRAK